MTPRLPLLLLPLAGGCLVSRRATITGNPAGMTVEARAVDPDRSVQTPLAFGAVVGKVELLHDADDLDPTVIFDGAEGDTPYELVELTEEDEKIGSVTIPTERIGTYTHVRVTVAAVSQRVTLRDPGGEPAEQQYVEFVQPVDNSRSAVAKLPAAPILRGDVLVDLPEAPTLRWFEIDADRDFASSGVRSEVDAYQDPDPGVATQLLELDEELEIESAGDYVLSATFDPRDTFAFLDRDGDGAFEPFGDDHDGTTNGFGFSVRVPGVAVSVR